MNAKSFQGLWPHMSLLSCCVYNVTLITCAADVRRWSCIGPERVYTSGSLDHLRVYKDILSWWFVIFSVTVRRTLHKHVPGRLMFTLRCCRGRSLSGQMLPPVGLEVHVPAAFIIYLIYKPYLEVFGVFSSIVHWNDGAAACLWYVCVYRECTASCVTWIMLHQVSGQCFYWKEFSVGLFIVPEL